jgi:Sec-independent protein secretion pathway component TatC
MLVFMAPMIVLYFLSIGVSAAVVRRKRRAESISRQGVS